MLEYKLKWFGLPTKYVNPKNSSKTCPLCQATMVAYEGRLMRCRECGLTLDRDVVAVMNLRMWGSGVTPKALIARAMMGDRPKSINDYEDLSTVNPNFISNFGYHMSPE